MEVNQQQTPPIDNRFVSLGEFRFEQNQGYVLVSNEGTSGHVTADAVQFLPLDGDIAANGKNGVAAKPPAAGQQQAEELKKEIKRMEDELRKTAEECRIARDAAEAANNAKTQFLSVLSHELRTPLTPILLMVTMLEQKQDLPAEVREDMAMIRENIQLEARLIDDLLDISRIVAGKMRIEPRPMDATAVVESAVEALRPSADAARLGLDLQIDPKAPPILGDPERLQQVVWNLLSNAIKFTGPGGRVRVVLRAVDRAVEIEVSDTGRGITPEVLPHVFDRFRQADSTSTRARGGLGLGLALARRGYEIHFIAHRLPFRLREFSSNLYFHEATPAFYAVFEQARRRIEELA